MYDDRRDARARSSQPSFLNSTNCRDEDGGGGGGRRRECAAERDASARVEIDRSVDRSFVRSFVRSVGRVEEDVEEDANEASFKGETLKSSSSTRPFVMGEDERETWEWEYGHVAGACDIAHGRVDGKTKIVTCGADSLVCVRDGETKEPETTFDEHEDCVNALAMSPCGTRVATASGDYSVKTFSLETKAFEGNVTRFTLPVHAIAWSADGKYVAAGGEDTDIKVIKMEDKSVQNVLACPRSKCIKSLAFDPRGDFLAATDDNGTVFTWVLRPQSDDEEQGDVKFYATEAPTATGDSPLLNVVAWRPDGQILAVPGRENNVTFFERSSFKTIEWELKGHTDAISLIRWSPNGKYLVTASADKTVMVWDVKKKLAIAKMTDAPELVCGASFSSSENTLALITGNGEWTEWKDVVPSKYASPTAAVSPSEIDFMSAVEEKSAEDFLDTEVDAMDDDLEEEDDFVEYDDDAKGHRQSLSKQQIVHVEAGPKPQAAFQTGSVAPVPGSSRRFLSYTMTGSLVSITEGEFKTVEFQFHDTSRMGRIAPITDYNGYTMGFVGEAGCVLASPMKESESESTLYFHPYESWTNEGEWEITMPAGEDILSVASGSSWVAAVTSKRYLRIYSLGGAQRQIISLEGAPVSITGKDDCLAVVWHEAAPIGPAPGDQVLAYAMYNMRYSTQLARGRVALSSQSTLTYLGFSEDGMLLTNDSAGTVRVRTDAFGGSWTPIFRSSAARATDGKHHWVVSASASTLYCIITKTSAGPTTSPSPVVHHLPLSLPIITPEQSVGDLEDEVATANLGVAVAQTAGEDTRLAMASSEKAAIKLFHTACKSGKLARAADIAETFRQPNSLRAVLKLPAVARHSALVRRINDLIETTIDPEPTQLTQGYTQTEAYTPAPAVRPSAVPKGNPFARKSEASPVVNANDENKDTNEREAKRDGDATPTPSKAKKTKVAANPFAR